MTIDVVVIGAVTIDVVVIGAVAAVRPIAAARERALIWPSPMFWSSRSG